MPYPAVFGHEGAGVIEAVGSEVPNVAVGDHVIIFFPWCGPLSELPPADAIALPGLGEAEEE